MVYALFSNFMAAALLWATPLAAQTFDFETTPGGELPPGWSVNVAKPAKPVAAVKVASGTALLVNPLNTAVRHGSSASFRVAGQGDYRIELQFAFGGSGRAMRIWSTQEGDPAATALNLAIENGRLMQFHADAHEWEPVGGNLAVSGSRADLVWHRLRIDGSAAAIEIRVWPERSPAPSAPNATVAAHRPGLRLDALHFGCDRLSPDAFYVIDNLKAERTKGAPIPAVSRENMYPLWSGAPIPEFQDELPDLPSVTHAVIHDPTDGQYTFLHGAAMIHHRGKFYANWASSPVDENSDGETLQGRWSIDGVHWSPREVIGAGDGKRLNNSHGIYHAHNGVLWAYSARFGTINTGVKFPGLTVEGFTLNEQSGKWESKGIVAENMWPYNEPVGLPNGTWITGGQGSDGDPGVLISDGQNFAKWRTVMIPAARMPRGFGETTLFSDRPGQLVAIIRPGRTRRAWVSISQDQGATWSEAQPSNFPIGVSKMYGGRLSNGQRYLVANFPSSGVPNDRYTMAIAVSQPGEETLSKLYRLRFGPPALDFPGFAKSPQWSYPYAHEYDGKLYVVYSIGKEKCGLSIIPLTSLTAE